MAVLDRRLGTSAAAVVVTAAAVVGVVAGLVGGPLLRNDPGPAPPSLPSTGAPGPPSGTSTNGTSFLGADQLLDLPAFAGVGWAPTLESAGNGEPQFAYTCQRHQFVELDPSAATVSASWDLDGQPVASQTVASIGVPPQAARAFTTVVGWYGACRDGSGEPRTSRRLSTVGSGAEVAEVWATRFPGGRTAYDVVARRDDLVTIVDLYAGDVRRDGLAGLAQSVLDRLG